VTLTNALAAVVDLQHAHRELLRVVDSLSSEDWERGVPYGEWTVKDLVAHCIGDMSPSGPGLIAAGVLTPEFIAETSRSFDVRARNRSLVEERRRYTPEDLRQLLFEAHDARIEATLRLNESHQEVLDYAVPMGPEYEIRVEDWLWYGYHDRQHAEDIRRTLRVEWKPEAPGYVPEVEEAVRKMVRGREGLLRAVYSVADDAWDEPAYGAEVEGWSYKDVLAHVSTNDLRPQTRLRRILGAQDDAALAALLQTDEWNAGHVDSRKGKTVEELVDEMQLNRHELTSLVSQLRSEHLSEIVRFASGEEVAVGEYLGFIGRHDSVHASQLVAASRGRRVG
jgi:hypothetical protein